MLSECRNKVRVVVEARIKARVRYGSSVRKQLLGERQLFHYNVFMGSDIQMPFEQPVYVRRGIVRELGDVLNRFYLCQIFIYDLQDPLQTFVFAHLHVDIVLGLVQYTKYFYDIGVDVVIGKGAVLLFEYFFN